MSNTDREEFNRQAKELDEKLRAEFKGLYDLVMDSDPLDKDGYPTEDTLLLIERWHWSDTKGWFDFIHSIWHLASWGWSEGETPHEYDKNKMVYRYHISTGGWSGNESIIRAMERNWLMWSFNWVQSRRGGHYIFELYEVKDDE